MKELDGQPAPSRTREPFEVQIVESYSVADRNDLAEGEKDPSGTSVYQLQWRPTEKHILVVEGVKTVCHVGLVGQTVEVQGNLVSIAGIGGVLVRLGCRGRGYCRMAMAAAENFALSPMAVNFMLLFCGPTLQSLYEHLGWAKVSGPVWAEQIQGNVLLPIISMVKCLRSEQWPKGEVRLGSRPW
jgi:predicted GNAT family N-acyltransferase